MDERVLENYMEHLRQEERSESTRKQYQREIEAFLRFAEREAEHDEPGKGGAASTERQKETAAEAAFPGEDERNSCGEGRGESQNTVLSKDLVIRYKEKLQREYKPSSVNTKLAAINGYLTYIGRPELRVKQLKIQRSAFSSREKELSKQEYLRMIRAAEKKGDGRLSLVLQTIGSTGIRVSELSAVTAEAVSHGEATVQNKGKVRTVLLPAKLCQALKSYMAAREITEGPVFITKNGKPLDRSNIWKMMKRLCEEAAVAAAKAFPHNLRHLFARSFYALDKDVAKLADILGHSSINTTRIYIASTGQEHRRHLECLDLVV